MDNRRVLTAGCVLPFPGMACTIEGEVGRGSNGVVYEGCYMDQLSAQERHRVLIKELYPLLPEGGVTRGDDLSLLVDDAAQEGFDLHRLSFQRGNDAHLALLARSPERIGANLNTFALNGTYYTVLGYSGGRSLQSVLEAGGAISLKTHVQRMLSLLDALGAFHGAGCVHLDVSPDNALITGDGAREQVMLIDFNSVHALAELRQGGAVYYSAKEGYTPPEVRMGRVAEIGMCSDLFSAAAVFYRMIAGAPLTAMQQLRKTPPEVDGCPCMHGMSEPVQAMVRQILRRGLAAVARRRYQTIPEMRADLRELLDRIEGVGVTHWALWEAGKRTVARLVKQNASLSYLNDPDTMYPLRAGDRPVQDAVAQIMAGGASAMITAPGGMGKTTALLDAVARTAGSYSPGTPAAVYVPLYDYRYDRDGGHYIIDRMLAGLHFRADMATYADARQALTHLLDTPLSVRGAEKPAVVVLLDGLNEAEGDLSPLIHEMLQLAARPGVRLIVTSRTEAPELPFRTLALSPLTAEDVQGALTAHGLLLPESDTMRDLLTTPMMLATFIRASLAEEEQLHLSSADELLAAYLGALLDKEQRALDEQSPERWQLEAAVKLVLPALAEALARPGDSDRALFAAVEKCWKLLRSRRIRRLFPRWTGHAADIAGGAKSAEDWYGLMVHTLLWQRLGLLVMSGERYRINHQIMAEYLLRVWRGGVGLAEKKRTIRRIAACALAVLLALCGGLYYAANLRPTPYDLTQAETVFDHAVARYASSGMLNENLDTMALAVIEGDTGRIYIGSQLWPTTLITTDPSLLNQYVLPLADTLPETGDVMPWSGEPLDVEWFTFLMTNAAERWAKYSEYADALLLLTERPDFAEPYLPAYPEQLQSLLAVDRQILACLYRLVCLPHLTGLEAHNPTVYKETLKAAGEYADESLYTTPLSREAEEGLLQKLLRDRQTIENEIEASGVLQTYKRIRFDKIGAIR